MIGYVKGTLISVQNGKVLLEVGGVGYEISVSNNTVVKLPAIEKQATIYTYLYVREDEMSLFGFYSLEEKAMFMKLISISGIGWFLFFLAHTFHYGANHILLVILLH